MLNMEISDLANRAADALRGDPALAGLPVIVEEKGDAANALEIGIGKRRIAAVVGWDGFESDGNSSRTIFGTANLVVSVFEMPVVNRRMGGGTTLLAAARAVAYALNLMCVEDGGGGSTLVFRRITPVQQLTGGEGATVAVDVVFETKAVL